MGKATNHAGCNGGVVRNGYALAHVCQLRQAILARAKESGERKEKILARRSKGRLLHILQEDGARFFRLCPGKCIYRVQFAVTVQLLEMNN